MARKHYVHIFFIVLCGILECFLLQHTLHEEALKREGFKPKEWHECDSSNMMHENQRTLVFCVNVNALSHMDQKLVDNIVNTIEWRFIGISVERVKWLNLIGMEIGFIDNSNAKIVKAQCLKGVFEQFEDSHVKRWIRINKVQEWRQRHKRLDVTKAGGYASLFCKMT